MVGPGNGLSGVTDAALWNSGETDGWHATARSGKNNRTNKKTRQPGILPLSYQRGGWGGGAQKVNVIEWLGNAISIPLLDMNVNASTTKTVVILDQRVRAPG